MSKEQFGFRLEQGFGFRMEGGFCLRWRILTSEL